jgi:hypothetical protein
VSAADALAAAVVQEEPAGGVSARKWFVAAVGAGPPITVSLKQTSGGAAFVAGVRISATYAVLVPAVDDYVYVLVTTSGGSGRTGGRVRGGDVFVVDKVAF